MQFLITVMESGVVPVNTLKDLIFELFKTKAYGRNKRRLGRTS